MTDFVQDVVNDEFPVKTGDGATVNDSLKTIFRSDWKIAGQEDFDTLEGRVTTNESNITGLDAAVITNAQNISDNAIAINNNSIAIAQNTDDIATKGNFFTGATATAALATIGLTDSSFSGKNWGECGMLIKNAMVTRGGGYFCLPFGDVNGAPNLSAAIENKGGNVTNASLLEGVCSLNNETYPVIKFSLSGGANESYISNVYQAIEAGNSASFQKIYYGKYVAKTACNSLASFSEFNVFAERNASMTHIYGYFKPNTIAAGEVLFTIPNTFDSITGVGCVSYSLGLGSLTLVVDGLNVKVDTLNAVPVGDTCYVNITY